MKVPFAGPECGDNEIQEVTDVIYRERVADNRIPVRPV